MPDETKSRLTPDGGLYLSKRCRELLARAMLDRHPRGLVCADSHAKEKLRELADAIYEECGLEYEIWT